ncbi:MAG: type II and III secretion system protein, partial [Pirellulales bacterium]|nr:type II and III secretion system protein [Pirellulales bacterium]
NIQTKIPWLGDLPYLGILFQRRQVVKNRAEIVVTLVPHIQPYQPVVDARETHDLMRTLEPLTVGPLDRYDRPYEARLPDTFTNPRRPVASLLHSLPPVDTAPTCYPTTDVRPVFPLEETGESASARPEPIETP